MFDFVGAWGNSNYDTADLPMAFMSFDWTKTSVLVGQYLTVIGPSSITSQNVAWYALGYGGRFPGAPTPEILMTERFTKEFSTKFGLESPDINNPNRNNWTAGGGDNQSSADRTTIPAFEGALTYESDALGKVGPWKLWFELAGVYTKKKNLSNDSIFATSIAGKVSQPLTDKDNDVWEAEFKWLVPIIGEKNGNKAGGLVFDGDLFTGQAATTWGLGTKQVTGNAYARPDGSLAAVVTTGTLLHGEYWFTDAIALNAWWAYTQANGSIYWQNRVAVGTSNSDDLAYDWGVRFVQAYSANLVYNVNPALRITAQWDAARLHFAKNVVGLQNEAVTNTYRVCMQYFF